MIVICTKCQAKFRVADDKIGPRGAKVRCSRCREIFIIQRPAEGRPVAAAVPPPAASGLPPGLDLEARPSDDPFAVPPAPPSADPFAAAFTPRSVAPPPDPFAGEDPFATSPPPPDPFAGVAAPPASDPFAPPTPGPGVRATLPVTDLADVLGAAAALPAAAPPADPFGPPVPFPDLEPPSVPFPHLGGGLPGPAAAARPLPDPFVVAAPPAEPPAPGDLALEDRLTPPPQRLAPAPPEPEPALDVGAIDPFAAAAPAAAFDPGAYDGDALGGDAGPLEVAAPAPPVPDVAAPELPPPVAAPRPTPRPAAPEPRPPPSRGSRVRAIAVNAVALAALLLVTLVIWGVWHAEGPLEAASLRPSAILSTLRHGGPEASGPWTAQDVGSGLYERARGAPLLFVRGRVLSRAAVPVPGVRVKVEVLRGQRVIASGEALAGAVPSPEELHAAVDPAALARAVEAGRARAPAEVRPGESVPFLVALGDAPAELEGASLRLALSPAARSAPAVPAGPVPPPATAPPPSPGGTAP